MRREALTDAKKVNRMDLVEANEAEIKVLESFLPAQLSNEELTKMVEAAIADLGATSLKEMGAVMKVLLPEVAGRAPNATISTLVRERLS